MLDPRLDLLRLTGLVGIGATAVLTAADLIMLYTPRRSSAFRIAEIAPALSRRRVLLGDYLGIFTIPLVLVGLWHIHLRLRPAGWWFAGPPVILLAYTYVLGAAFHHVVGVLVRSAHADAETPTVPARTSLLAQEFLRPLYLVFTSTALLGSGWLFLSLLLGRTAYPPWMAWLSPFVTGGAALLGRRFAPAPVAGVLGPAGHNLAVLVFLICSTLQLKS